MPRVLNKYRDAIPPNAKYIGRGSKWGNPFKIGVHGTRQEVLHKYAEWLCDQPDLLASTHELTGYDLICFCKPQACHGDILLDLANPNLW